MNTRSAVALALSFAGVWVSPTQTLNGATAGNLPSVIVERGRDHRVMETSVTVTNELGEVVEEPRQFTALETGMHYWEDGSWKESEAVIEAFPLGAIARKGALRVVFAPNLNTQGAIDLEGPNGVRVRSHLMGLAFYSPTTRESAMIAEVQDSQGELIPRMRLFIATRSMERRPRFGIGMKKADLNRIF